MTLLNVAGASELDVFIGTYTRANGSRGIYHYLLNSENGALTGGELAVETTNPTFLALHPQKRFLYAAGENKGGMVSAFAIGEGGKLTLLNERSTGGGGACHVSVDEAGKNVLVANYGGGSVEVLPIGEDGLLGEPSFFEQYTGSGPNAARQDAPHAHYIEARGGFAYACDLGTDKVHTYKLDAGSGKLTAQEPAMVPAGAGPRHMAFSATHAYSINELANTVTVFERAATTGVLSAVQNISTLPADFTGKNTTAEIALHPGGKFLYGSNRGHNTLAVFAVAANGQLTLIEHTSTQGKSPRHFGIEPSGRWLIAANQDTNNLVLFKVDSATGKLTSSAAPLEVPAPVCVVFR